MFVAVFTRRKDIQIATEIGSFKHLKRKFDI